MTGWSVIGGCGALQDVMANEFWRVAPSCLQGNSVGRGLWRCAFGSILLAGTLQLGASPAVALDPLEFMNMGRQIIEQTQRQRSAPVVRPADRTRTVGGQRYPAPLIREVQERLNRLGYSAGVADGLMGPKTRTAIRAYQRDAGLPRTGRPDPAMMTALRTAGRDGRDEMDASDFSPPPAEAEENQAIVQTEPGGAASFAELAGFDLPLGDYRSGLDEPALSGITVEVCQSECGADSRCLSYTFNVKAAICILKDTVPAPAPFAGAVSGIKVAANEDQGLDQTSLEADETQSGTRASLAPVSTTYYVYASTGPAPDGSREQAERLAKLLVLRGNPELLQEDPAAFMDLLPEEVTAAYYDKYDHWIGDDEFQRKDSRQRFLNEQAPRILEMVPQGNLHIVYLQRAFPRNYEDGGFPIEPKWMLGGIGGVRGLSVPQPLTYPDKWMVDEVQGRAIREMERSGLRVFVRTDYLIRGTANIDGDSVLDLALTGLSIVPEGDPEELIAALPIPEGAIELEQPPLEATPAVEIEPETFRLYAAKHEPQLLADKKFVQEGFLVRQYMEKNMIVERDSRLSTSWPHFLRTTMLETDKPDEAMLSSYRKSVEDRLELLPPIVLVSGIGCSHSKIGDGYEICDTRPLEGALRFHLSLSKFSASSIQWRFASEGSDRGIDQDGLRLPLEPREPIKIARMPAGSDLPVFLLLQPDRYWQETWLDDVPPDVTSMDLELKITDIELQEEPRALVVGLRPHRVLLHSNSKGTVAVPLGDGDVPIEAPEPATDLTGADIMGLRLGMDVAEAKTLVRESMTVGWTESGSSAGKTNPKPMQSFQLFIAEDGWNRIALFWSPEDRDRLAGIGRVVAIPSAGRDLDSIKSSLIETVLEKYGEPDYARGTEDREMIWTAHLGIDRRHLDAVDASELDPFDGHSTCSAGVDGWRPGILMAERKDLHDNAKKSNLPQIGPYITVSTPVTEFLPPGFYDRCGPMLIAEVYDYMDHAILRYGLLDMGRYQMPAPPQISVQPIPKL